MDRRQPITMKYITVLILGFLGLISCTENVEVKINTKFYPEFKNHFWTSEFYYYRNVYKFNNGNRGICYEHQVASSCPIDLKKFGIPEDSMLLVRELPFIYSFNDSIFKISLFPSDGDTIPEREFNIIETSVGNFNLKSKYEYTYGNEILFPEPKYFKYANR
jgi:hypothetical protein